MKAVVLSVVGSQQSNSVMYGDGVLQSGALQGEQRK